MIFNLVLFYAYLVKKGFSLRFDRGAVIGIEKSRVFVVHC